MAGGPPLTIAEVSVRTGIPVPTLRFYERELPSLFQIGKTEGGHRRYAEQDVRRFEALRRLTREEGFKLSEVRSLLTPGGTLQGIRQDLDLLLEVHESEVREIERLRSRLEELEKRLVARPGSRRPAGFFRGFKRQK